MTACSVGTYHRCRCLLHAKENLDRPHRQVEEMGPAPASVSVDGSVSPLINVCKRLATWRRTVGEGACCSTGTRKGTERRPLVAAGAVDGR
jgi:hypothetical protein|eukprot:COSAG06_NODE_10440_length_1680_cov_5.438963_2_plen_91_part_00